MASSVSSERAFSSAGITISKRRNRLKQDVVEALQCLKCSIKRNVFFRFDASASASAEMEQYNDLDQESAESGSINGDKLKSWDEVWLADEGAAAAEDGEVFVTL